MIEQTVIVVDVDSVRQGVWKDWYYLKESSTAWSRSVSTEGIEPFRKERHPAHLSMPLIWICDYSAHIEDGRADGQKNVSGRRAETLVPRDGGGHMRRL